ncbi:hypothetical protein GCM10009587_05580 [Microbacterium maritypicum]
MLDIVSEDAFQYAVARAWPPVVYVAVASAIAATDGVTIRAADTAVAAANFAKRFFVLNFIFSPHGCEAWISIDQFHLGSP